MDDDELGRHGILPEENDAPFSVEELLFEMLGTDERIHGMMLEGDSWGPI